MDDAQKISSQLWIWYKKCRDTEKDDTMWNMLLDEGEGIVNQYKGDDYIFARNMCLAFLDRVERMERRKNGESKPENERIQPCQK
jgi:hypothetical protein